MSRVDMITNERVFDDRHHMHEFQEFWRDSAVALAFLPQFGSVFGLAQARELTANHDKICALGARIVLIGIGTSIQGFTFRQRARSREPVMVTKDASLYRTMGLGRAARTYQGLQNLTTFASLVHQGVYPFQRTGDPLRLGGIFVVPKGGAHVSWEHRPRFAADLASGEQLVTALERAIVDSATAPSS
ncbi:peroxiredoxin-like family protein [Gordonia sp. CPCC 205333]|uniref:peroxiredoxin-like family protein n=1 Tax=Gordonia sp. CPCC 205333 TaxID=3140790 RepID=UPI003AF3E0AF